MARHKRLNLTRYQVVSTHRLHRPLDGRHRMLREDEFMLKIRHRIPILLRMPTCKESANRGAMVSTAMTDYGRISDGRR